MNRALLPLDTALPPSTFGSNINFTHVVLIICPIGGGLKWPILAYYYYH